MRGWSNYYTFQAKSEEARETGIAKHRAKLRNSPSPPNPSPTLGGEPIFLLTLNFLTAPFVGDNVLPS